MKEGTKCGMTVRERVRELLEKHGTFRAVSAVTGVPATTLHDIATAASNQHNLRVSTVSALGLQCGPWYKRKRA